MVIQMDNRFAIIENHRVVNVVIAQPDYAEQQGWVHCPVASPGWDYIDGVFVAPTPSLEQAAAQVRQPTKEELLAQLASLQQQIQSLV